MKKAFDFHSRLVMSGENLSQPVQFLPGGRLKTGLDRGIFTMELTHLPIFTGVLSFYAEKSTMAQPLLKGELR
jgi:hypothetical protein